MKTREPFKLVLSLTGMFIFSRMLWVIALVFLVVTLVNIGTNDGLSLFTTATAAVVAALLGYWCHRLLKMYEKSKKKHGQA